MNKEPAPMDIIQTFLEQNSYRAFTIKELQEKLMEYDLNHKRIRKACSGLINRKIIILVDDGENIVSPLKVQIKK